jgi:RimJ/RimL family protein N-acetyltransferase
MNTHTIFETDRLFLRPTSEEDAAFVLELMNTPKWLQNIGDRNVKSVEDAKAYIQNKMRPQLERLGYSNYTVIRKSDAAKLGSCGLYDRAGLEGVDIGFAFLPAYEKQGYALEAASKMKEVGRSHFGLTKISAITTKENIGSQKLLEKLGLTFVKIIRLAEDSEDLLLYQWESDVVAH